MKNPSIGIIGAGLAGLSTAYFLNKENVSTTVLEARERLGGRVFTKYSENHAPIELGATWLGKKHRFLLEILKELDLEVFEQYMGRSAVYEPISTSPPQIVTMPHNPDPTLRIKGGTSILINRLAGILDKDSLLLKTKVTALRWVNNKVVVETDKATYEYDRVILTIPPKLLLESIKFEPPLPPDLMEIGKNTHTWMSESIKVALTYQQPFWKDKDEIGSIFSNTGLISEMYDHSNYETSKFALKGFINGGYAHTSQEERKSRVLDQLSRYFGNQVNNFLSYEETIWRNEEFTHSDYDGFILPHQNNGNPIFQSSYYNGQLFIGGSETATQHPGYMDGAIESGYFLAKKVMLDLK